MPVAAEHADGGPVYFALVDPEETTFDPEVHARYDEYIFRIEIDLEEAKLPIATVEMKNPGALLAPGRKRWCWIAFRDEEGNVVPKFFGRLIAIPTSLFGEVVTIVFEARPLDYVARRQEVAAELLAGPYADTLFIDPVYIDDPDTALEGLPGVYHYDPVTHEVTYSSYLVGEDGGVAFGQHEIVHDSLEFELGDAPPGAVKVEATVAWTQHDVGSIGAVDFAYAGYYGQSFLSSWPKQGAGIGSGYTVLTSVVVDGSQNERAHTRSFNYEWKNANKEHRNGDHMSVSESYTKPVYYGGALVTDYKEDFSFVIGDPETGRAASMSQQISANYLLNWSVSASMALGYEASREFSERIVFTLYADQQPWVTDDDGEEDIETLTLNGGNVGAPLGEGDAPIGDLVRRSYFRTDRGGQSVHYAFAVARARIISKSRPAETRWTSTILSKVLGLSLRMSASAADARRLPGGSVNGKIYKLKFVADSEELTGSVVIKSAAGKATAIEPVEGTPVYADADVLGPDVQIFSGRFVALESGDLVYTEPVAEPNDDGLVFPLTPGQAIVSVGFFGSTIEPDPAQNTEDGKTPIFNPGGSPLAHFGTAPPPPDPGLVWRLELAPINTGGFNTTHSLAAIMSLPKQVDLQTS